MVLSAVALGGLLAHRLLPTLVAGLPSEMDRTGVILQALRDPPGKPRALVFGNSVVMNGVNARALRERLAEHPHTLNLASSGQGILEACLFYEEIPESVEVVVQGVFAHKLDELPCVRGNKYSALSTLGYEPAPSIRELLSRVGDPETRARAEWSKPRHTFASRWIVRDVLTQLAERGRLPKRPRHVRNLFYPHPAHGKKAPEPAQVRRYYRGRGLGPNSQFLPKATMTDLLCHMKESCHRRHRQFVLVVLPVHPEFGKLVGPRYLDQLDRYVLALRQEHGLLVINCVNVLEHQYFCDPIHPNNEGAAVFTDLVAAKLDEMRVCSSTRTSSSSFR